MEKARMVLALDHRKGGMTRAEFLKCKNWRTPENPRGLMKDFFIYDGCQFGGMDPEWWRDDND